MLYLNRFFLFFNETILFRMERIVLFFRFGFLLDFYTFRVKLYRLFENSLLQVIRD